MVTKTITHMSMFLYVMMLIMGGTMVYASEVTGTLSSGTTNTSQSTGNIGGTVADNSQATGNIVGSVTGGSTGGHSSSHGSSGSSLGSVLGVSIDNGVTPGFPNAGVDPREIGPDDIPLWSIIVRVFNNVFVH